MNLNPFRGLSGRRLVAQPDRLAGEVAHALAEGDAARDRRDWASAAQHYRRVVDRAPKLTGIWVQLGHALKEQGDCDGGLAAYQTAWSLDPSVADTALQLGHVHKLMHRTADAIAWYQQALRLGGGRDAARELAALGVDRHAVNAVRAAAPAASPVATQHALLDMTALWRQRGPVGPNCAWQLQIALAAVQAGAKLTFVVADPAGGQYNCVAPDTVAKWLAGEDVAPGAPCDHVRGAVLLLGWPWAAGLGGDSMPLQTAMLDLGIRPVLFAPDMAPISSPEWFAAATVAAAKASLRSVLPLAAGVIATDRDAAAHIAEWAALNGLADLPVAALDRPALAVPRTARRKRHGRTVALLPRDAAECRAMAKAWQQQADIEHLHLLGLTDDAPAAIDAAAFGGHVTFGVLGDAAYNAALAEADLVLVPASRPDGDAVIADALRRGCCVMADANAGVYERWGAAIAYYVPFRDARALAAQWRQAEAHGPSLDQPAAMWGQALAQSLQQAGQFGAVALPAEVPVGIYHDMTTFGAGGASAPWRNGGLLRYGQAWGAATPDGCSHGPAPAILRMRLNDALTETYICRLLHRNPSATPLIVRVASGNPLQAGQNKAEDTVHIPAGGHAWSQIAIPTPPDGQAVDAVVSLEIVAPATTMAGAARPVLGGLFVHPADQDHLWYEFMDAASRCEFPSLLKLHR